MEAERVVEDAMNEAKRRLVLDVLHKTPLKSIDLGTIAHRAGLSVGEALRVLADLQTQRRVIEAKPDPVHCRYLIAPTSQEHSS